MKSHDLWSGSETARDQFSSVQSLSCVWFFVTPWTTARQASLSITNSRSPPKPMSIKLVVPSNHLIPCHPFHLSPSIFPSIQVFSSESVLCIRWPKYWGFSFSISPSDEYSGLISFRMDWLDLLAVQGTLKSHIKPETLKLLEENIGKTLSKMNHSRILYDPPPRILEIKGKSKQMGPN